MGPGRVERRAFAYIRPGTWTLIPKFDIAQGRVVAASLGPTRPEAACVTHTVRTIASDPKATRWHSFTDNWNIPQSESSVCLVAEHDGLQDDLG
jgi:hypothetical protein